MGEEENGAAISEVFSLLDDVDAASILAEASKEARSVSELVERCDAHNPTIYRRIEKLLEHDLLYEEDVLKPNGRHYKRYKCALEQVTVSLDDGEFIVEVTIAEEDGDAVDRLSRMYEGLR